LQPNQAISPKINRAIKIIILPFLIYTPPFKFTYNFSVYAYLSSYKFKKHINNMK
jgi:hypothetical protein